ncbi:FKBP-type peptidyl-prolyl cis-trans isomerase [Brucepastera parasyntrophica]|uniref:FKBP-type peptidyl-prolyl cis-trans isomerase n=1 Tax=Brucepastera parasyntrophica TaxID=2880008 RepID=UPI0034E26DF9
MTIAKDSVVSIEYKLTDEKNEVLDSSDELGPLEYLHGHNNLIPGLEKELTGKKAGDHFSVTIPLKKLTDPIRRNWLSKSTNRLSLMMRKLKKACSLRRAVRRDHRLLLW